jgi:dolichol kinase
VVALLLAVLSRESVLLLLGVALLVALLVEWGRVQVRWIRYHFLVRFRRLLRSAERRGLSGATYMAGGYLLAVALFPPAIAAAAILYNAFGDATAAVVGRRWGRRRTRWGKSLEGAVGGLLVNLGIGLLLPGIAPVAAVAGAIAASLLEFLPLPMDDNLRITLGGGAVLWFATILA